MSSSAVPSNMNALYCAHSAWLHDWLKRHTHCSDWAADLTQETFCRLIEKRQNIVLREPRAFLATMARRLLIDDVRRRDVERAWLSVYAVAVGDQHAPSPERIAEAVDLLNAILKMLEGLSEKARRSFLMIRSDGMSYAEVGAALGISDRMVKRYVAQAYAHCYMLAYSD